MVIGAWARGVLHVWPWEDVALLREEVFGRVEVTSRRGEVAHRPGPVEGVPLPEVRPGTRVHPAHALRDGANLRLPGGWVLEGVGDLPPAPPVEDPPVAGLEVRRSEVLLAERRDGQAVWVTDRGVFPARATLPDLARAHPWLVRLGRCLVNLRRVERAVRAGSGWQVHVRGGPPMGVGPDSFRTLCAALGLPPRDPARGEGPVAALYRLGLRDWPDELLFCEAEVLAERFRGDTVELIAQVIWQVKRYRELGLGDRYGRDIRGLYYTPLEPVLERAGAEVPARPVRALWLASDQPLWLASPLYRLYERVLSWMVGDLRLLTFGDLRFRDPRPEMRRIGAEHPEILVAAEKTSLLEDAFALSEQFGASAVVLGGTPSLLGTEKLVEALRAVLGDRRVKLVTFADWDVSGWEGMQALAAQMERYGMRCEIVGHLVRPERFTAWELDKLSYRIPTRGKTRLTKARQWLEETGGIGGELRGIHADHLRPTARVVEAFLAEVGLLVGRGGPSG